jgi:plasmid maintenance system antidote protein VapI
MTDQYEKMRATVLAKVSEHRAVQNAQDKTGKHTRFLGQFIEVRLQNQRRDAYDLAQTLNVSVQVIELLLAGEIPGWMLSDETLVRLAHATGCEVNLLRIILKREIDTTNLNNHARMS